MPADRRRLRRLNAAQGDLTTRKAALAKRKSDLDAREKKITDAERAAKANSFGGDGIYLVGTDIQPGTYKAAPSPSGTVPRPGCVKPLHSTLVPWRPIPPRSQGTGFPRRSWS